MGSQPREWHGVLWVSFWGFMMNSCLVLTTWGMAFFLSLLKVAVSVPLASFFMLVALLVFFLNMRVVAAPKDLTSFIGLLWPLPLMQQAVMGISIGVVLARAHQYTRLHVHHEWGEESIRYGLGSHQRGPGYCRGFKGFIKATKNPATKNVQIG